LQVSRFYPIWERPPVILQPKTFTTTFSDSRAESGGALAIVGASALAGGCIWAMASPDVQAAYARLAMSMLSHWRLSLASPCSGEVWLLEDIARHATKLSWSAMRRAVQMLGDRDVALPPGTRVQVDGVGHGDYVGMWIVRKNRLHGSHIIRFDTVRRRFLAPVTLAIPRSPFVRQHP
jgi:hypothetical protein